ncbi:hypothetical protein CSV63_12885 [Sporosarcina sp. P34]|uniref:SLATT domain-containing protein n=1 Tax=Sporosarcina sp. P34 TaxID=2048247 RepID=UPI000C167BFF|nr:SLATT domain-containing protein [Sporosarcina sp. P34]PID14416.1 hypothetical protein CSV63_12885 [Sporosarcina sp. P34]
MKNTENANLSSESHQPIKSLKELERRIDITRRARFACSTRLRNYFDKIQNLIVFYNIVVVLISIITLYQFYNENAQWTTFITLAISIALSFFATHMGGKNYKEKAILMESNGHDLSKIYGKIEMLRLEEELDVIKVSNLYKEYERTLAIVENHEHIDYLQSKKAKNMLNKEDDKIVEDYYNNEKRKFIFAYSIPLILGICILLSPFWNR